jgi:hypothetical protein
MHPPLSTYGYNTLLRLVDFLVGVASWTPKSASLHYKRVQLFYIHTYIFGIFIFDFFSVAEFQLRSVVAYHTLIFNVYCQRSSFQSLQYTVSVASHCSSVWHSDSNWWSILHTVNCFYIIWDVRLTIFAQDLFYKKKGHLSDRRSR